MPERHGLRPVAREVPHYFFDFCNGGGLLRDEEGADFEGIDGARSFAVEAVRDIAADDVRAGRGIRLGHFVAIRDIAGAELTRVTLADAIRIAQ